MVKKKPKNKGKGAHLGGMSLGSTRKDPYNNRTWEPPGASRKLRPYKPFEFKPVTGITGKEKGSLVRFKGPAIDWKDRPEPKKKRKK